MNWHNIRTVYFKELLDTLRDKRTLISSVIVPLLLFPLMTIGFGTVAAKAMKSLSKETVSIMVFGQEHAPTVAKNLERAPGLKIEPSKEDYRQRIGDKRLRAAIEFPPGFEEALKQGGTNAPHVKIYSYEGEVRSQVAVRQLQALLRDYSDKVVGTRLAEKGLSHETLKPFKTDVENVAPPEKVTGSILGGLIPYMIIFLCFVGAVTPAIDVTAGEKERGTMETILVTPISRSDLVAGKFLLVVTVSLITTLLSVTSFAITFSLPMNALKGLGPQAGPLMAFQVSALSVVWVLIMLLPLAVFFSALLIAVGTFARTFKEAQTYISPMMVLVIIPAVASTLPGFDLSTKLALVPILNVSLVCKDVLTANFNWGLIALTFASSCAYAGVALFGAVQAFKRESVLFRT
jgi:sodium transport system permease protein